MRHVNMFVCVCVCQYGACCGFVSMLLHPSNVPCCTWLCCIVCVKECGLLLYKGDAHPWQHRTRCQWVACVACCGAPCALRRPAANTNTHSSLFARYICHALHYYLLALRSAALVWCMGGCVVLLRYCLLKPWWGFGARSACTTQHNHHPGGFSIELYLGLTA